MKGVVLQGANLVLETQQPACECALVECETWSITLKNTDKHYLRINIMQITETKRGCEKGIQKSSQKGFHTLYCSPKIVRVLNIEDCGGRAFSLED